MFVCGRLCPCARLDRSGNRLGTKSIPLKLAHTSSEMIKSRGREGVLMKGVNTFAEQDVLEVNLAWATSQMLRACEERHIQECREIDQRIETR